MLLSHNLFKLDDVINDVETKEIKTVYIPKEKKASVPTEYQDLSTSEKNQVEYRLSLIQRDHEKKLASELTYLKKHFLNVIRMEKKKFFVELHSQREKVLTKANEESQKLKLDAYEDGFQNGQKTGYEIGLEQGYKDAQEQAQHIKANALSIMEQAQEAVQIFKKDQQVEFINLATMMAENIINRELALSEQPLEVLLEPILNKLDKTDNFITIFVTRENQESTINYLMKIKKMMSSFNFTVLVDETLEKNGCKIETNYEILDLQIGQQLEKMKAELLLEDNHE